jgi:hypothetical protein
MAPSYPNGTHYAWDFGEGNREIIPRKFRTVPRNCTLGCATMPDDARWPARPGRPSQRKVDHMTALMDPMPATRPASSVTRTPAPAARITARVRRNSPPTRRAPDSRPSSTLAACLRRFGAAGLRLVVTTPADHNACARGIDLFPERRIDGSAHIRWETAHRIFCGRGRQPHDRGSWRILAVDRDDRVVGAITARFFCSEIRAEYLQVLSLLDTTGPVFREHCELALAELMAATTKSGRTPAEISNWAVAPVWHASLIAVTLMRAMGALVAAFDAPVIVMAADNRRGEVNRLMRLGCTPLSLAGHFCLPPFVHHETGAWLRLLVLDAAALQARHGDTSAADLALLRAQAAIVSNG